MQYNDKTFCVLPFIHKHKRLSGVDTLCCTSQYPIYPNNISELQQKIINGEKILHCKTCYLLEDSNLISPRIRENNRWLSDPEVKEYIDLYVIGQENTIFSYDLRYSNTCNLACIGCTPQQSSLWAKELNVVTKPINFKFNIDDAKKAKWIYLAGGEPFLTPELIELLEDISKQDEQPSICINTNLTVQDDSIAAICEKLKSLTLQISIDGVGSIGEYHRWPLKWSKFKRNLEWVKNLNCNITFNTVVDAVNVSFIHEIIEYQDYPSVWSLNMLVFPQALSVENIPDKYKKYAYDNFIQLKNTRHYTNDVNFKTTVDTIAEKIFQNGDSNKLSKFIQQLDNRRNINHVDFLGIDLK